MSIHHFSIMLGGIFLLICSIYDIRYKRIPTKWIIIGGIVALLWICLMIQREEWGYLSGGFLGISLLLLGRITEEKIGYGDGLVVLIVGVLDTFLSSFLIFAMALFLITIYGAVLICFKKISKTFTIPFVPFYFVAYLLWVIIIF